MMCSYVLIIVRWCLNVRTILGLFLDDARPVCGCRCANFFREIFAVG